jgi:L-fucose isomerase-like protein
MRLININEKTMIEVRKIKVKMVAHKGAPDSVFEKGEKLLAQAVSDEHIEFVEADPDVIFFVTGGSERSAAETAAKRHWVGLWAHESDNSYASAIETKAYFNQHNKDCFLWDIGDTNFKELALNLQMTLQAKRSLKNRQLGLLGDVSEWLLASDISDVTLKDRFGIDLVPISWDAVPLYKTCDPSPEFDEQFGTANPKLNEASQVHGLLQKTIRDNALDAITIECFPLVKEYGVTACLSLSLLNDLDIPAGCEGDLTAITGMMFAQALTGKIPWMANTNKIGRDTAKFAHCTVPLSQVKKYTVPTHFETNEGTAIQGELSAEVLTVFRFDALLEKMFVSLAQVINRPKSEKACRTQIEVQMPTADLLKLKTQPLGNHHLFLAGDHRERLSFAAQWFGISIL